MTDEIEGNVADLLRRIRGNVKHMKSRNPQRLLLEECGQALVSLTLQFHEAKGGTVPQRSIVTMQRPRPNHAEDYDKLTTEVVDSTTRSDFK